LQQNSRGAFQSTVFITVSERFIVIVLRLEPLTAAGSIKVDANREKTNCKTLNSAIFYIFYEFSIVGKGMIRKLILYNLASVSLVLI